mmetsp:Transcript_17502/g.36357  ORF Transcript_17502/g.36357 Transcript_17502/m.36357 type:complete len:150 (-) Transcript_17502:118-567(-)
MFVCEIFLCSALCTCFSALAPFTRRGALRIDTIGEVRFALWTRHWRRTKSRRLPFFIFESLGAFSDLSGDDHQLSPVRCGIGRILDNDVEDADGQVQASDENIRRNIVLDDIVSMLLIVSSGIFQHVNMVDNGFSPWSPAYHRAHDIDP